MAGVDVFIFFCSGLGAVFALMNFYIIQQTKINPGAGFVNPNSPLNAVTAELKKVEDIHATIELGAKAFLRAEYTICVQFLLAFSVVLLILTSMGSSFEDGMFTTVAFLIGGFTSILSGLCGMMVAVNANARTTVAAASEPPSKLTAAFNVAFRAGAVMGYALCAMGLATLLLLLLCYKTHFATVDTWNVMMDCAAGFGLGGSSVAMFGRVGGGIYTKAADVGADLVGKVVHGLEEDDPKNPATIADNVGDNVGDVAGMGADLFESYVGSIIAAATLAPRDCEVALPFWLAGAGVLASLIGTFAVSTKEKGEGWNSNLGALMWALEKGTFLAGATFLGLAAACCHYLGGLWGSYLCVIIGLATGVVIGKLTEYFTSFDFAPVQSIKARGSTGPATVVIQGLGVGMLSCVPTIFVLVAAILGCAAIKGEYGIAIAAVRAAKG